MKSIIALCVSFILGTAVSMAQFFCNVKDAVLTYSETSYKDKDELKQEYKVTVLDVNIQPDGVITNRTEAIHKVPGNDFAEIKSYESGSYNPVDRVTTLTLLSGDDYKDMVINLLVDAARAAGQPVSDSDIAELKKNIRVKGDLVLPLPFSPETDAKIPNSSIKMSVATNNMSINLWEGKYLGYETVEVPAGQFQECLKVSYVKRVTSPEGNEKSYVTAWYCDSIGMVKTVETDKKGNVLGEEVLLSITK